MGDSIVPEQDLELYQVHSTSHNDELAAAKEQIRSLMKAGKTDAQCRELADASKQQVKDSIKTERDILHTQEDGSACALLGQEAINSAKNSLNKAKIDTDNKKKDYDKKRNANVDFPSYPLSSLSPGSCNQFYSSAVYKDAVAARDQAKTAWETAKGVEDGAVKALKDAEIAAEEQKNACLCTVQKNQNEAYDAATKKSNTGSMDSLWRRGHLLHCALDDKDAAHCPIPAAPKITRADLNIIDEAKNKDCTAFNKPEFTANQLMSGTKGEAKCTTNSKYVVCYSGKDCTGRKWLVEKNTNFCHVGGMNDNVRSIQGCGPNVHILHHCSSNSATIWKNNGKSFAKCENLSNSAISKGPSYLVFK